MARPLRRRIASRAPVFSQLLRVRPFTHTTVLRDASVAAQLPSEGSSTATATGEAVLPMVPRIERHILFSPILPTSMGRLDPRRLLSVGMGRCVHCVGHYTSSLRVCTDNSHVMTTATSAT